ncbi:MAG: TonB-dependent receptor, partial [Acidobacteriota bacterium]|nr:TonB-dependent receptor [Acidobacteriota bacterium]
EEHKDGLRIATLCRMAQRPCAVLAVCLGLHTADVDAAGPRRHFELEAGAAPVMLNEFSRQSDLQVLFDFNILKGLKTRRVTGDLEASAALTSMLQGTNLGFDFVNDHTLAVTPKKPTFIDRLWHRLKSPPRRPSEDEALEQVLISGAGESGTYPLLGSESFQFGRADIERSGRATTQDFLRTLPQVFGGGPTQDTVLGREASSNSARGAGVNLRGLDAGATLVLIDGRRTAPSGIAGAFTDVSNIPLSIVDHVDLLPDGASAKYGADAVGGVINFVTRRDFSGAQTQMRGGGITDGSMGERQFSQLFGNTRDSGSDFLSFEYFQRDPLRAQDRAQYTSDLTRFGGSNFNVPYGNPGTISDGAHYWPIPAGLNGAPPTNLTQGTANLYDQYQGAYILPKEERWSVFGKEHQKLTDDIGLSLEGLFTRRKIHNISASSSPLVASVPQSNPFYVNPTGVPGPVTVTEGTTAFFGLPALQNRVDTGNFALGVATSVKHSWMASVYVAYTFEKQHLAQQGEFNQSALDAALADPNPATSFNPFGDAANNNPATLAAIGGVRLYDSASSLKTATFTAVGPTLSLPGGDVEATIGVEYRVQNIATTTAEPHASSVGTGSLSRDIRSEFGELRIPLIGEGNEIGLARRLEFSMGARHESYSDIGSATIPKFGLYWSVNRDLSFRSTWTKSFRPPNLTDMVAKNSYSYLLTLSDPSSPTGMTTALGRFGTNTDLRPETARSWTVGTDLAWQSMPGLSASLTYFNINYSNRIDDAQFGRDVLSLPTFAWLVSRNVSAAELQDACNHSVFNGPGTCQSSVSVVIDNRLRNIKLLKTDGVDLTGRYSFENRVGKLDFGLNATYLLAYSQANTPGSPLLDIVSTQNNPINLKARGSASWTHRGLGLSTVVNFQNSYRDTLSVPNRGISPWTTFDLQLSYETVGDMLGWLRHTQFVMNAQNLFNVNPPFLNNPVGVGYDQENADLYGRLVSFEVRKRW